MFNKVYDQFLVSHTFELSSDDLDLVLGGSGPSGAQLGQNQDTSGGALMSTPPPPPPPSPPPAEIWAESNAAFNAQQQAQQNYDQAVQNTLEAAGNLEMGSATRHANEGYNAYQQLQGATENLYQAVDRDMANYEHYDAVSQQIANGQGYSPADANVTTAAGLPAVVR